MGWTWVHPPINSDLSLRFRWRHPLGLLGGMKWMQQYPDLGATGKPQTTSGYRAALNSSTFILRHKVGQTKIQAETRRQAEGRKFIIISKQEHQGLAETARWASNFSLHLISIYQYLFNTTWQPHVTASKESQQNGTSSTQPTSSWHLSYPDWTGSTESSQPNI